MRFLLFFFLVLCVFSSGAAVAENKALSDGRFQVLGDGTVLDRQTELMWAAQDNSEDINWEDAGNYCQSYNGGGHKDWRLPTQRELITLFNSASPEKYKTFPPFTFTSCCPWTSDNRRTEARSIFFMMGERAWYRKVDSKGFRALPVRDPKKTP